MPTDFNPELARKNAKGFIELECHDGRSSCGSPADDAGSIVTPGEVVHPFLQPRIEQWCRNLCFRIDAGGLSTLVVVAD